MYIAAILLAGNAFDELLIVDATADVESWISDC